MIDKEEPAISSDPRNMLAERGLTLGEEGWLARNPRISVIPEKGPRWGEFKMLHQETIFLWVLIRHLCSQVSLGTCWLCRGW